MTLWQEDSVAERKWLLEHLPGEEGVLVMLTDLVDKEFIDAAPQLKVISTMSVGFDHIDVEYAGKRGIIVSNTPDVLTEATADLGIALVLAASRRLAEGDRLVRRGGWKGSWNPRFMLGKDLAGKTLGILGMGRIGMSIARKARAFGLSVIYNSRSDKGLEGTRHVSLDALLAESDFLILAVELNRETERIIDGAALGKMKESSILVNISRGRIVDESALFLALKEKRIAGAALDVYEEEPLPANSPLLGLDNVVLSPHLGSATIETRDRMAELAARNLLDALSGKRPRYVV